MAAQETLDETDLKILQLLQQDSSLTVKELAAKVNLSASPTFERQKRLERDGYITRYSAIADPRKLGNDIVALCNIRLKQHNTRDLIRQFMDTVKKTERITECYNTTGDYDFSDKSLCPRHERLSGLYSKHSWKIGLHRLFAQCHSYRRNKRFALHTGKQ